jgi:hypothetical protein
MTPFEIPPALWQRISIFESVWVMRGSALEEADIRRAGIFVATQVVVLADVMAKDPSGNDSADDIVDADAIFCYQAVRRMRYVWVF